MRQSASERGFLVGTDVGRVWCAPGIFGEIGSELLYFVFGIVGVIWGLWMLVVTLVGSCAGIRILRHWFGA
jgi:hypothetical protein